MKSLPPASAYPKKIHFQNETYRIIFDDKMKIYGETNWQKKTVRIKAGMSRRATFATFIHELLHVIEFEMELDVKHKLIYAFEKALVEIWLDNFL